MSLKSFFFFSYFWLEMRSSMSQVKTGAICALAGIIGGGVLSYERENDESARFLKHMDEEIQVLRDRADVHGKYWDSLKNVIYKKDSHCCTSAFMVIPMVTTTLTVVTVIQVSRIVV